MCNNKTTGGNKYAWSVLPQQGWQCPICGRIMSPTTPFCPCEGQGKKAATGTTVDTDGWKYRPTTTTGEGADMRGGQK